MCWEHISQNQIAVYCKAPFTMLIVRFKNSTIVMYTIVRVNPLQSKSGSKFKYKWVWPKGECGPKNGKKCYGLKCTASVHPENTKQVRRKNAI